MKKLLGLLALGGLMMIAAPAQHAQATTLINPGIAAPAAADAAHSGVTDVRYHRGHRWHRHPHSRRHHWHPRRHWHPPHHGHRHPHHR
jgi:hypothetical protein